MFIESPVNANVAWHHSNCSCELYEAKQLEKHEPRYSSSLLLYMNKKKVGNFSCNCFLLKCKLKSQIMSCYCHHTFLSWKFFLSSFQKHTSSYSVQFEGENQHSCSHLLADQMKQWGILCLAQGPFDRSGFLIHLSVCLLIQSLCLKVELMEPNVQTALQGYILHLSCRLFVNVTEYNHISQFEHKSLESVSQQVTRQLL